MAAGESTGIQSSRPVCHRGLLMQAIADLPKISISFFCSFIRHVYIKVQGTGTLRFIVGRIDQSVRVRRGIHELPHQGLPVQVNIPTRLLGKRVSQPIGE